MIQTLRDFMAIEAGKPFAYGVSDCCLMVADWWQWVHGVDPAPGLRGAYGTRKECLYLIRQYGSLANLMFSIANGVGARTGYTPSEGNFGVALVGRRPVGFIRSDRYILVKPEAGLAFLGSGTARVVAEWSI